MELEQSSWPVWGMKSADTLVQGLGFLLGIAPDAFLPGSFHILHGKHLKCNSLEFRNICHIWKLSEIQALMIAPRDTESETTGKRSESQKPGFLTSPPEGVRDIV